MNTTIQTKLRAAIYCLCAAASMNALGAASAADTPPTRRVSYADLDISKPAGAKVLYRRIDAAAHRVCVFDARMDPGIAQRQRACIKQAIDNAVKSVNSAALTELHAANVIHLASQ
jgi:UrcA family protein